MLELEGVSLSVPSPQGEVALLSGISVRYPRGHFAAIIGPSGCGKTSMLTAIAGIATGRETGDIRWNGENLNHRDFHASEIAYVPQFSIAHDDLTVMECIGFAHDLRVGSGAKARKDAIARLLQEVGLESYAKQYVRTLSGGQKRRLALAIELTSKPEILLCDEVTSGLDTQSEDDVFALLHDQSHAHGRLVLSVTHSLRHLDYYDSVLVLNHGRTIYHGPPGSLTDYFSIEDATDLFLAINRRDAGFWESAWESKCACDPIAVAVDPSHPAPPKHPDLPGLRAQFAALFWRRMILLGRRRSEILLQTGFILGFPLVVALFAWNGLPAIENLSLGLDTDGIRQFEEALNFTKHSTKIGGLVSGIVMFQVILLTLMGANNSGREIAAERNIYEKERISGLRPFAYVSSKAAYLLILTSVQSFSMGIIVHSICGLPGDFSAQLAYLFLVNAAVTSICLGISSFMRTPEQASLTSVYLVGFQLPLSGAVLALPDAIGVVVRPFVSAYWAWSGILQTMREQRVYDILLSVVQSPLAEPALCVWVIITHIGIGFCAAWIGCERRRTP